MARKRPAQVGLRQVWRLAEMPSAQRFDVIAEGLPIILESARELERASLMIDEMPRVANLLVGLADEEAAKVLILMDAVRCPEHLGKRLLRPFLKAFYSHGARLIYAWACGWRPTDVAELRSYVDQRRKSHYVDGPTGGDFIFPNDDLFLREATLYADLAYDGDENVSWSEPAGESTIPGTSRTTTMALRVAEALSVVGAFTADGVRVVASVWHRQAFERDEHAARSDKLIHETLERLFDAGLPAENCAQEHVSTIYRFWQMPMYTFDFRSIAVPIEDLEAEREASLYSLSDW